MGGDAKHGAAKRRSAGVPKRDQLRRKRLARSLSLFLAMVLAFAAGFLVRSQPAFVSSLGFTIGAEEDAGISAKETKSTYDSVSARVSEVEDILDDSSLAEYDLAEATGSMIGALMGSTDDPYAAYFSPDRYSSYVREAADRSYAGIGVIFSEYNGRAYVADVFEGSEAETKGVRQGDFVAAVDGVQRDNLILFQKQF